MLFSLLLGTSLVALVIPVSIGMYVNHKWPQKAKIILKVSNHAWDRLHTSVPCRQNWNEMVFPSPKLLFSLHIPLGRLAIHSPKIIP